MKNQRLPRGWTQEHIRKLAENHDRQTAAEQAAEIDAAIKSLKQPWNGFSISKPSSPICGRWK